ncbi:MAG: peptidylprolyl isomerase [Puniceicoccales bacterium]|jgi:peptidyl-prolyl cis-trans isomerase B (cyclophilin B)|nr:peptidylprolyl isomerase [Puniceicoccales bacterium]
MSNNESSKAGAGASGQITGETATIHTSAGDMTFTFFDADAPGTIANFKKLSREGFYNNTAFHRIIRGFMIQGGCPNTKPNATGTPGTGGPGYTIKAEFNSQPHRRGVISMARSAHPDSAGSQFFICHDEAPFLNRQYTAFGRLIAGDDVLEKIASSPVAHSFGGEKSKPLDRIEILGVTINSQQQPATANA